MLRGEWLAAPTAAEENGQLLGLLRRRMVNCSYCSEGEWPAAPTAQEENGQLFLLLKGRMVSWENGQLLRLLKGRVVSCSGTKKAGSSLWANRTGAAAGGSGPVAVEGDQVKVEAAPTLHPVWISLQIKMASRVGSQAATVVKKIS
jgi:hypothetical protein